MHNDNLYLFFHFYEWSAKSFSEQMGQYTCTVMDFASRTSVLSVSSEKQARGT